MTALRAQLEAARAHAQRLTAERDKLMEISNMLRADLNALRDAEATAGAEGARARAADAQRAGGGPGREAGRERGEEATAALPPATRIDALEAAMEALSAQNGRLQAELAGWREAAEHVPSAVGVLTATPLGDGHGGGWAGGVGRAASGLDAALRASLHSSASARTSADSAAAGRARLAETRLALDGAPTARGARPGSAARTMSERETSSQLDARARETARKRAELARRRAQVPNYGAMMLGAADASSPPATRSSRRD